MYGRLSFSSLTVLLQPLSGLSHHAMSLAFESHDENYGPSAECPNLFLLCSPFVICTRFRQKFGRWLIWSPLTTSGPSRNSFRDVGIMHIMMWLVDDTSSGVCIPQKQTRAALAQRKSLKRAKVESI